MKPDKFKKLVEECPEMFEYFTTDTKGGMFYPIKFGAECGSGWDNLIISLTKCIYDYCKCNNKQFPKITQIKEKYGGLRYYVNGASEYIYGMISFAEDLSYHICERCGSMENVYQTDGWIQTVCEKCEPKPENFEESE